MVAVLQTLYLVVLSAMAIYGLFGLVTLAYYWPHRHDQFAAPEVAPDDLPQVTVQLPIYNERLVVARLIEAAVALDYPGDRLQIQVLDDSTDETAGIAANLVARYRAEGVAIEHLRRADRAGFKAGALAAGLPLATGEYVALFDADFQPAPDFLRRTIPHFFADAGLGAIQARWGHLNADHSFLTGAQAIGMDKHFAIEQTVRHRADLFPKFNGTAGIWRRACMEAVGGWQSDTVCEDLCLSTRAVLAGWRFRFLNDVVAPAELPASISAFKNQQARWAKGSTQCLRKFGREILHSERHRWQARAYALLAMSAYANHLFLLLLLLLLVPLVAMDVRFSSWLMVFGVAAVGQPALFLLSQQVLYADWPKRLRYVPGLLLIAVGLAPSNSRAVLEAFLARRHDFVRTPKGDALAPRHRYRLPLDWVVAFELLLAFYAAVGLAMAIGHGNLGPAAFLFTSTAGLVVVAIMSLREQLA